MAFKVAIASGKGGTGKTTVAVNLFQGIQQRTSHSVQLVDCDVEEPNDALFFPDLKALDKTEVNQQIPVIDTEKCHYCRECVNYCEFNAIVVLPPVQYAEINADLCHSCGACLYACNHHAITERPEWIGHVTFYDVGIGKGLVEGRLKVGSAMQTMMIRELKKTVSPSTNIVFYDAPPGTSCPVVETIADADYVILVTEPTPFGLHDLTLTIDLAKDLKKTFGVIVNKAGLGSPDVYEYLNHEKIEVLGEIPFSQAYAAQYAKGTVLETIPPEIKASYSAIINKLETRINDSGNNHIKR
jgi:MinD superfamily P-loop ATPase